MLCSASRIARSIARRLVIAAAVTASVAACTPPSVPDEERRPEPRADAAVKPTIVQAADAYKDQARAAGAQQEAAAERQRAELDAATR
ncbi:MAG TPA: hypothetical protein VN205_01095 [Thermomonas sp.]|nr:hypothetical protein [Thermomonas sp.]